MHKLRWLGLLMGITILGVTGFQLYWLRQNYSREKKALTIKAQVSFRETIRHLQVAQLNLDNVVWKGDDSSGKVKIFLKDKSIEQVDVRSRPGEKIVSTINVISDKLKDSLKLREIKPGMVISLNQSSLSLSKDSLKFNRIIRRPGGKEEHIINMLYGVDSLQDSLRVTEIDSAYSLALKEEKLAIPFSIIRTNGITDNDDQQSFDEITVGLANPVTYKLQLGNTVPYLFKQILQPILFSILLLGITILSFVLLYRSLLQQRRLAELKNEFISNITHELKTPIATVGVAIEALKNFNAIDNPQRTKEYLDISQNELQRLGLLVDKVLKLSMFEKKEVELKYEVVNLEEVVNEVVSSLKLQLEKNRARVTVSREGDVNIQGDHLHLLSVVFNLVDNAVKYSKDEPSIHIELKQEENNVLLKVTDNGIGIAAEYKDKLFDKFFRVPHGDTHNAKGYGLGLSYVAQVIRKHKGTISVESQPGIGTKFSILLPKTANA